MFPTCLSQCATCRFLFQYVLDAEPSVPDSRKKRDGTPFGYRLARFDNCDRCKQGSCFGIGGRPNLLLSFFVSLSFAFYSLSKVELGESVNCQKKQLPTRPRFRLGQETVQYGCNMQLSKPDSASARASDSDRIHQRPTNCAAPKLILDVKPYLWRLEGRVCVSCSNQFLGQSSICTSWYLHPL